MTGLAGPGGLSLDESGAITVTFPPYGVDVITSFAEALFPPGVKATRVPVDGLLDLHISYDVPPDDELQEALAYDGSGRVLPQRVVEVGGGSARIAFDMPVRILLDGQAGGRAFYIDGEGGAIVPIDAACAADDAARVHRHLDGAGECQMDSVDGGKIIYTYHLTRFGTVLPENAAPPPALHTCSVSVGTPDLAVSAQPGGLSAPVLQTLINSGSAPFVHVDLAATPWRVGLPASATEVSEAGPGGGYGPLAERSVPVAGGLGGGDAAPLWFRLNLAPYGGVQGGTMVQHVTYQAQCAMP